MSDPHTDSRQTGLAVWNLGFRPFFLGAGIFSVVGIAAWLFAYQGRGQVYPTGVPATLWHAHEMLFGYALAVISGFLLTAVKTWTGLQTPRRAPLAALFVLWALARLSNHLDVLPLAVGAAADLVFNLLIVGVVSVPILKTRQWRQTAIIGKLVLIAVLNSLFYLDAYGLFENGAWWAVYGAFYTIVALVLMMARRLIPFFVERGVGYSVTLRNYKVLDVASLVLFVELMISELFGIWAGPTLWVAAALFMIHLLRLAFWYTPGIWRRPLLWSLYLAYTMLATGFLLFSLTALLNIPKLLALHTFAIGGIGLMTLSMMARVSLGHTGRDIHKPPLLISIAFVLLAGAALTRVAGPIYAAVDYSRWVELSAWMWIAAFTAFVVAYTPVLLSRRVDKPDG